MPSTSLPHGRMTIVHRLEIADARASDDAVLEAILRALVRSGCALRRRSSDAIEFDGPPTASGGYDVVRRGRVAIDRTSPVRALVVTLDLNEWTAFLFPASAATVGMLATSSAFERAVVLVAAAAFIVLSRRKAGRAFERVIADASRRARDPVSPPPSSATLTP